MQNPLADQTCLSEWSLYLLSHSLENVAELLQGCTHNQPARYKQIQSVHVGKVSQIKHTYHSQHQHNPSLILIRSTCTQLINRVASSTGTKHLLQYGSSWDIHQPLEQTGWVIKRWRESLTKPTSSISLQDKWYLTFLEMRGVALIQKKITTFNYRKKKKIHAYLSSIE